MRGALVVYMSQMLRDVSPDVQVKAINDQWRFHQLDSSLKTVQHKDA